MSPEAELFRLLRAVMRFVDRHAERKHGPGVVEVPLMPHEMRELRASLEPFRARYKEMDGLFPKRLAEICEGSPATALETEIRGIIGAGQP